MQIRKFLTLFLALCLCLSLVPGAVFAEEPNNETPAAAGSATVTFDPNNGEAPWTQTVELNEVFADVACGKVTRPADPAKAAADGKRYAFNCWVANGSDFFSEGDAYVSEDITVTASYTEYLAEGWQIRVISGDNYSYITDTATPLSTLLADTSATYNFEPVAEDSQVMRGLLTASNEHTVYFYYTTNGRRICDEEALVPDPQMVSVSDGAVVGQFPTAPAGYHYVRNGDYVWSILNSDALSHGEYSPRTEFAEFMPVTEDMSLGAFVAPHTWDEGSWVWRNIGGYMYAQYHRECTGCGEVEWYTATVTANTVEGVTTFTATVTTADNTLVSDVRTLAEMYTVTFGEESNTYPWGGVATYNSPDGYPKKWMINDSRVVADGVSTFVFAVTEDATVTCVGTEATEQQAVLSTALTSTETGKATFNAKWSLPEGAKEITLTIYRGFTAGATDVDYGTMYYKGTETKVSSMEKARNGDFTLNLTGLTSGTYQHVIIRVNYKDRDDIPQELISGFDGEEYYIADRVLVR